MAKIMVGSVISTHANTKARKQTIDIAKVAPFPDWLSKLFDLHLAPVESITPLHTKKGRW